MHSTIKNIFIATAIIMVMIPHNLFAQRFSENEVRAAFLCNFAKFVEWPENSFASNSSPVIIGFLNDSVLASVTTRVAANIKVNGRELKIVQYKNSEEAAQCHILYISPSMKNNIPDILNTLSKKSILTVSETENFCKQNGMVNFSKKKTKFGFEINDKSARQAGLIISSKLLALAVIIE